MAGRKAALLCQDAPYNVPVNGHVSGLGRVKHREFAMASGEMSSEEFKVFLAANLAVTIPHLAPGAIMALFMDHRGLFTLQKALYEVGAEQLNLAVWVKSNGGMGSLYRSQHELVVIAKHDKAPHINNVQLGKNKRYRTNVWRYPGVNSFGRQRMDQIESHPTPKPIPLVADVIRDVTNRGQIIFDGFMGSGTTILAAERTGRIAYGLDIDPGYVDVTIQRWQKMTSREAGARRNGGNVCAGEGAPRAARGGGYSAIRLRLILNLCRCYKALPLQWSGRAGIIIRSIARYEVVHVRRDASDEPQLTGIVSALLCGMLAISEEIDDAFRDPDPRTPTKPALAHQARARRQRRPRRAVVGSRPRNDAADPHEKSQARKASADW